MDSAVRDRLKGIIVPIASPCTKLDEFDEDGFVTLAQWLYSSGVHGLYVCGATGDGYKMTVDERKRATELAVEVSRRDNGVVIVHVGSTSSRDAVLLAEHAAGIGVDAVASMRPPNSSLEELVHYYTDIANATALPVLVYHIPTLTGVSSTLKEILELLDIEGVVGLKCSDWNLFFLRRIIDARPQVIAFNGMDELLCPGLLYGCVGGIGMWYNVIPRLILSIYESVERADVAQAMELQKMMMKVAELGWEVGLHPSLEYAMARAGLPRHLFRRPRVELDDQMRARLDRELSRLLDEIDRATGTAAEDG